MGMNVAVDCELGLTLSHGGGYPGYGSHVLLLPDYGVGIFALANRTYAGPRTPVWDAAVALRQAGERHAAASHGVQRAGRRPTRAVGAMWAAGAVTAPPDALAMNFLMDRDADHWARDLAALKADVGTCETTAPITADRRAVGRVHLDVRARPRARDRACWRRRATPQIQALSLSRATP